VTNSSIYNASICTLPIRQVSLEAITDNSEFSEMQEFYSDTVSTADDNIERRQREKRVKKFLDNECTEREKYVIERLYYQDASQTTIAAELGLSQPMVSKTLNIIKDKGRSCLSDLLPMCA
tara:strand:- start:40 stop:402 length:363 start_codon:yes stop_codon:yes gene_type:complete